MTQKQRNNPLHGITLERLLTELVDHYGFDVLAEHININCFKSYPSIKSSLKFLRKTEWAREKVEAFYLYKLKSLPKANDIEYELPPRERTIPEGLEQRPPKKLEAMSEANANAEVFGEKERFLGSDPLDPNSLEAHFMKEQPTGKQPPKGKPKLERTQDRAFERTPASVREAKQTTGKVDPWAKSRKLIDQ